MASSKIVAERGKLLFSMDHSVRTSGTVLAALLHQCANSETDVEGFLMGMTATRTVGAIDDASDQTSDTAQRLTIIDGHSAIRARFYNAQGQIDVESLYNQLGDRKNNVIGYFRFRRQSALMLSVREEALLQNLGAVLPQFRGMAILTASLLEENDASTHAHDIAFWDAERYNRVPIDIVNMTESTLAYQQFVPSTTLTSPQILTGIDPKNIISQYDSVYHKAMDALNTATQTVIQKEQELQALMDELERAKQGSSIQGSPSVQ
ncbi:hypothetical protein BDB00DRAFT_813071 [Zychaea mexicana]|uniref:uncharacterized protein n=1 Tax=Zychaea mexicana TaxID=64656 RepID=UPI0022FF050E|nr:uncharacterized protein BDB00DRAFT_813071 [Zychaea mexicana]KAI9495696.1 hypothetical protein BDB00DRAFT_813071 [Zychaea mexicana]